MSRMTAAILTKDAIAFVWKPWSIPREYCFMILLL